jgi:hypothetical protein
MSETCGGLGMFICYCGGDFCICNNNGEYECYGCEDCEREDDFDYYDPPDDEVQAS